ncbi:MAG: glycosyltransferase [bacterium]
MSKQKTSNKRASAIRLDVVLPVYNEEKDLVNSVTILHNFLTQHCRYNWRIIVADNASIDKTPTLGRMLEARLERMSYLRLPYKGRGRALRTAWLESGADIVSYMDIDLSTDLKCFLPMIDKLAQGKADLAIGSRFKKGARVKRGIKREVLSRGYISLIKLFFHCGFSDAQCGFKAVNREAVETLVPLIENQGWFFDAELLLLAELYNYKIFEYPVHWVDDPDSRVNIFNTVAEHFLGLMRMRVAISAGYVAQPTVVTPVEIPATLHDVNLSRAVLSN